MKNEIDLNSPNGKYTLLAEELSRFDVDALRKVRANLPRNQSGFSTLPIEVMDVYNTVIYEKVKDRVPNL